MNMTAETLFCVSYLSKQGITSAEYERLLGLLDRYTVDDYSIIRYKKDDKFFNDLAAAMRELWPPGDKEGKYPWRDSVKNIALRLKTLWNDREMKDYSIDQCLAVSRRYLSQFEKDTKYMMLLKYFIWKQKKLVGSEDGKITYIYESMFADMLEGKSDVDAIENEWESIINDVNIGEGELI